MLGDAAVPSPRLHLAIVRRPRAEQRRPRCDPHPPQVEAIRIPAGANRHVPLGKAVSVVGVGERRQLELGVGYLEVLPEVRS